MSGRSLCVYRLIVMYPEGSDVPGWRPARWRAQEAALPVQGVWLSWKKDLAYRRWLRNRVFRWPAERRFLSGSSAYRRAALLRSYGAEVVVERSLPVQWPDTCFTADTGTYSGSEGAWLEFDASGIPRDLTPVLLITDAKTSGGACVTWAAAASGPGKAQP